jgi:hypothetical protein
MYRLTDLRFKKSKEILEKYHDQFYRSFEFDARAFECELKECLKTGYKEIGDIAVGLLKDDKYRHVALYYMEHCDGQCVRSEFKGHLADAYEISAYDIQRREDKKEEFWSRFKADVLGNALP